MKIIHYDVQLSEPPEGERSWRKNVQLDILTSSAARAIELALEAHPGSEIHVVQRRGSNNLIIDSAIIREA